MNGAHMKAWHMWASESGEGQSQPGEPHKPRGHEQSLFRGSRSNVKAR